MGTQAGKCYREPTVTVIYKVSCSYNWGRGNGLGDCRKEQPKMFYNGPNRSSLTKKKETKTYQGKK